MTPRQAVLSTLINFVRSIDNGKYFAKRGAVNWAEFDFDRHPYACTVVVTRSGLGRCVGESDGLTPMLIDMDFTMKIPDQNAEIAEINDEALERLYADAEAALNHLQRSIVEGFSDVFRLNRQTAEAIEFHDPQVLVQGIVVSFSVTF